MGILRSETMVHGTLVIPHERAKGCVDLLSRHTNIQYVDMNAKRMDRPYKKYVQRIDKMERMIRVLYEEIAKLPNAKIIKHNIDNFLHYDHMYRLDQVEESLIKLYDQFQMFKENDLLLRSERDNALNEYYVMLVAKKQLNPQVLDRPVSMDIPRASLSLPMGNSDDLSDSKEYLLTDMNRNDTEMASMTPDDSGLQSSRSLSFTNLAGLISSQEKEAFSRAIFRAMRGNVFTIFHDTDDLKDAILSKELIDDEELLADDNKTVFVIYCQSSSTSVTFNKLKKLCNGFQAKLFNWSKTSAETITRLSSLEEIIRDKKRALEAYKKYFRDEIACLLEVIRPDGNSVIEEWCLFCRKEKYLYYILNHFEGSDITLRADCWFPAEEEEKIRQHLLSEKVHGSVNALLLIDNQSGIKATSDHHDQDKSQIPPTYNKTNVISKSFQNVVDTYGVPRYKEVNPAPFTVITFPFLFGIMFGDIAHGLCITIFGLFLIFNYHKLKRKFSSDIAGMIIEGRYMIFLMGMMATYTGFIYNDFLSIPNNFFGTGWVVPPNSSSSRVIDGDGTYFQELVPSKTSFPIFFGLDSAWIGASNEQSMLHSFKMKFSVIVGFLQMAMGIILKGLNSVYFSSKLDFFFEFIPQLAMMCSFVGYMNFLIFYKWMTPVEGHAKPSIISTIIDMCLMKKLDKGSVMYSGQEQVQKALIFVVILAVPLMLIPKPLITLLSARNQERSSFSYDSKRDYEMVYCGDDEDLNLIARKNIPNYPTKRSNAELASVKFKRVESKSSHDQFSVTIQREDDSTLNLESHVQHPHKVKAGDLFIHQFIETIEFSLGTISNTASYLRLWALSLSHQQLSLVFFKQIIFSAFGSTSVFLLVPRLFVQSIFFSFVTFFVMLCMDSLECYLHALRLQWVEFQNKFYKADGVAFKPFNIRLLLNETEAPDFN
ncbi:vacuolar ATP synthase subunit A, putative [Theileria equi strain WA]|uniref:V-type proton ATPase subunit a n=1 Tax=Theileria equi strain WA TaxID=1537102 RepID=L0B249_THEEQ|nr:vacuolar ATP synthase subunit A, putative [Theileria equi strain WA]AFZ81573.1 vacuolar ATP synthase subunit A, putative [Theileria equi strain WA]|eukprot:XP_004831239.1 vacuolar ATP synthase subunit A, putative [Theileria equi strain WA]